MQNQEAFKLLEERFSMMVRTFNCVDVSFADSDDHYFTVKDRLDLGRIALERAPEFRVTDLPRSLGDIYRAIRLNLTPEEMKRWNETREALQVLHDKYRL
ncbi:hypothetical protein GPA10_22475 [Streptomyces sp. p1417]|uniref:Uncharacterized protein n=1 Tax=Streptomyces typhae TaxID=2681492 RepID=A0A6L6X0Y6_9ACTN|nr:hypothetical protein [Streptomyces typhae]MVO87452.1 hypothetical protein [Streptomyces typhae]